MFFLFFNIFQGARTLLIQFISIFGTPISGKSNLGRGIFYVNIYEEIKENQKIARKKEYK